MSDDVLFLLLVISILLIFIIVLLLGFAVQRKNSKLRKLIMKLSSMRVQKMAKKYDYEGIAARYRRLAKSNPRKYTRENLLGLACVYEQLLKYSISCHLQTMINLKRYIKE